MRWFLATFLALGLTAASVLTVDGAGVGVRTNVCPDPVQPEITAPPNGTVTKQSSITVQGTATAGTLVTVFRNDSDAGSALVDPDGEWELSVSLVSGVNTLVAGTCVPSDPITVTFKTDKPVPTPGPPPAAPEDGRAAPAPGGPGTAADEPGAPETGSDEGVQGIAPGATPLMLISAERSIIRGIVDEELDFPAIVHGGAPPYRLTWEWDDGEGTTLTLDKASTFRGRHAYSEPGKYQARATVRDTENQTASYQFVADVIKERLPASGAPGGRPWSDYLIAGATATLLLLLVVLLLIRKRRRRTSSDA